MVARPRHGDKKEAEALVVRIAGGGNGEVLWIGDERHWRAHPPPPGVIDCANDIDMAKLQPLGLVCRHEINAASMRFGTLADGGDGCLELSVQAEEVEHIGKPERLIITTMFLGAAAQRPQSLKAGKVCVGLLGKLLA